MDLLWFFFGFVVGTLITTPLISIAIFMHLNKIGCDLEPFYSKGTDNLRMQAGMKEKIAKKDWKNK